MNGKLNFHLIISQKLCQICAKSRKNYIFKGIQIFNGFNIFTLFNYFVNFSKLFCCMHIISLDVYQSSFFHSIFNFIIIDVHNYVYCLP